MLATAVDQLGHDFFREQLRLRRAGWLSQPPARHSILRGARRSCMSSTPPGMIGGDVGAGGAAVRRSARRVCRRFRSPCWRRKPTRFPRELVVGGPAGRRTARQDVLASSYGQTGERPVDAHDSWRGGVARKTKPMRAGSVEGQAASRRCRSACHGATRRCCGRRGLWLLMCNSVSAVALYSELNGPGASRLPDAGFRASLLFNMELMVCTGHRLHRLAFRGPRLLLPVHAQNRLGLSPGGWRAFDGRHPFPAPPLPARLGRSRLEDRAGVYTALHDLLDAMEVDEIAVSGRHRLGRLDLTSASPFNDEDL